MQKGAGPASRSASDGALRDPEEPKTTVKLGIDPIMGKLRKNSLDRVQAQASEFPVINAERESASEHSKA
jgi:hypothetical protein